MPDARLPERAPELTVAQAFAGLPQEAPERSAWPLLEQRIAARQPRHRARWPLLLAAAAVLAVAAVMPRLITPPPAPATPVVADTPVQTPGLEALMAESAQLEGFITRVSNPDLGSANATMLSLEFEDGLQLLDSRLADPTLDRPSREQLWQRRVSLLRDYAGLQATTQSLVSQGQNLDGALVATF
ncbi:hypothetical protein [Arenimonas sp. MALMAid1274]|uniref:hypothetical protein n=1 Tax=Arenimonas sp. MALMAid1274 TaxID=3411630 RepID=UPI003BA2BF49